MLNKMLIAALAGFSYPAEEGTDTGGGNTPPQEGEREGGTDGNEPAGSVSADTKTPGGGESSGGGQSAESEKPEGGEQTSST